MSTRGSGGTTSEYTICLDTINRDYVQYPDTNDLVLNIDNARLRRGAVQIYVGSFELPTPQFTIEEAWQNLWFDEGIRLIDYASISVVASTGITYTTYLPLFLNSIASITVTSATLLTIVTDNNHALNLRALWGPLAPVASRLPIRLIGTGLVDPAEINLTQNNLNITIIDPVTFTLAVASTANFGAPGTVITNTGYIYAPAIDSPVALVAVINSALVASGFTEGSFSYDPTTSLFQFRTVFYGPIAQPTLNVHCPTGGAPTPVAPGVCLSGSGLVRCLGFMGSRNCATTQLRSGQWYIPADSTPLWRGFIAINPGFYGPQDLTQLGSEITIQFNRFYIDNGACSATPSIEYLYFSNAIGSCLNFVVPPGGYTPVTLAAFLESGMNITDPLSFANTAVPSANVYTVTWIPSGVTGFFSFACSGVFGLEFGDSIGVSSMPARLGFSNVAYRPGPEFSGRTITVPQLGACQEPVYYHSYLVQMLANNTRKGYRIEPSLPRVVQGLVASAVSPTTVTLTQAAVAHGFQVGDVLDLAFPAQNLFGVSSVVLSVTDAFAFVLAAPVGLPFILNNGDVTDAQLAYDPATFNVYFNSLNFGVAASTRGSCRSIYPGILGFDYTDLMAPAPYMSITTVALEPPPYLLLQVLDVKSSAYIQHNFLGDNITNILAKLIFYPTYQLQRLYPMSLTFNGSEIISQLHFRWLTPDHQLYQFHGRNWSGTLQVVVLGDAPSLACG